MFPLSDSELNERGPLYIAESLNRDGESLVENFTFAKKCILLFYKI